ncbi:MAG: TIGR02099 family protein [Nitrosomonadales bacterium]|nr:TIGR02099 family protein [Nitrosomonadales bacterium]
MLSASVRLFWRSSGWLMHLAIVFGLLGSIVLGLAILLLRYLILPDIMQYHDRIETAVSQSIGQPVKIGHIEADWKGFRPHLLVDDVRILDQEGQPGLVLPRVENILSWRSLLSGSVRLHTLEIDAPNLIVRRDEQGRFHVAGVPLSGQSEGNGLADWLLSQNRILIHNASIAWFDEQRGADPLRFEQVELRIENGSKRHRFALRAVPSAELAAPLDVRGDFYGKNFASLAAWRGQAFVQMERTDVTAWRPWLTLPAALNRGRGGLRAWLSFERGELVGVTADVALSDVSSKLAADVPELALDHLRGRLSWHDTGGEFEVLTHQLVLHQVNGVKLMPTDFSLHLKQAAGKHPASGELRANHLDLVALASLEQFFPMDADWRHKLQQLAPQGRASEVHIYWEGAGEQFRLYRVAGRFEDLGLRKSAQLPGFAGLSGEVSGAEDAGTLTLHSHDLAVDAPQAMAEPLAFAQLNGQLRWKRTGKDWHVELLNATAVNADAAGVISGVYQTEATGPGSLDLSINLSRADIHHADRYIPLSAMTAATRDWLRTALLAGHSDDLHIRLKGNLNDFPFADSSKGIFQLDAPVKNLVMDYASGWPKLESPSAELHIQGKRLQVQAATASTVGVALQKILVTMPDTSLDEPVLDIKGEAQGPTARALEFIQQSPVRGYIDGFTDTMTASGNGHLDLALHIPLGNAKPVKVQGMYRFVNNEVVLDAGVPALQKTNGDLIFTESTVRTQNVSALILGGPATLQVNSSDEGVVRAKVAGVANMEALRGAEPYPVIRYLHGRTPWSADISVQKKKVSAVFSSSLVGLESTLPQPFNKPAEQAMPLRLEKKATAGATQDLLMLQYGKLLEGRFLRHEVNDEMVLKRGTLNFGGAPVKWLDRDGVWVNGDIPELRLSGWGGLQSDDAASSGLPVAGMDLDIQKLIVTTDYSVGEVKLIGRSRNNALSVQLNSHNANGELNWQPQGPGKLVVHLKNLVLVEEPAAAEQKAAAETALAEPTERPPALDVTVDSLSVKGRQLGSLQVSGQPQGKDWILEKLNLVNPEGTLMVDGKLAHNEAEHRDQTRVNVSLQINDAGKLLDRSGYPKTVKQGSGKLDGHFSWTGGPGQFNYLTLDGNLKLETGKGQFLKFEPGIGKLLSVLSLQSLPKRITLDFNDVFSEGFQFDSISGDAQIQHGVLRTDNFNIYGSSAKVNMKGEVDLERETQNLRVRVLPTVGNSVSLLGVLAVSPVVGIGTFIANKILRDPLDKLVSFEYNVTGSWAEPNVAKVGEVPASKP